MGLIRSVEAAGGTGMVLQKGEPDAGTLLLILQYKAAHPRVYERMPQSNGSRLWVCVKTESGEDTRETADYITRRGAQDRDLWIIELDIAQAERFIGLTPTAG